MRSLCGCSPRLGLSATRSSYRGHWTQKWLFQRGFHDDTRNRMSSFWIPTGGIAKNADVEEAHELLVRAGFLRQTAPGIFHMLPLGWRVQEKIERLVDRQMRSLGASKLSLSSLSRQDMWKQSGRLAKDSAVFRTQDRRGEDFLLAPTQEEEITTLVGGYVKSYRDVPLRVYQISKKYRDELRPRQGLLRAREFTMKDLYTFDSNATDAIHTYNSVKEAYAHLFEELKLPYVVADADSGDMGGTLNHEFHIFSPRGEDTVATCSSCGHSVNEEILDGRASPFVDNQSTSSRPEEVTSQEPPVSMQSEYFVSRDKRTLVRAFFPKSTRGEETREINPRAVVSLSRLNGVDIDVRAKSPYETWQHNMENWAERTDKDREEAEIGVEKSPIGSEEPRVFDLYDFRVRGLEDLDRHSQLLGGTSAEVHHAVLDRDPNSGRLLDLLKVQSGDPCLNCGGKALEVRSAIELAHTFHLGTKYSDVFGAQVPADPSIASEKDGKAESRSAVVSLEMGCHGIGVSRMIAAAADTLADSKGLNWPRTIAPFEVAVISAGGLEKDAEQIYDKIIEHKADAILDDRQKTMPWKLDDADLIGYPVLLILGKSWKSEQKVEIQCRRLGIRTTASLEKLPAFVASLLEKL